MPERTQEEKEKIENAYEQTAPIDQAKIREGGTVQFLKKGSMEAEDAVISVTELQEWKAAVPELDFLLGLEYCAGERAFYLEMLEMFVQEDKQPLLNRYFREKDWEHYQTVVHALKSTALGIGLPGLSEQARQLEYAVKRKDDAYILAFHQEVMEHYEKCSHAIQDQIAHFS